jgi:hypothetical protein
MLPSFRFAAMITALVAVAGSATAQELAPANSGVSVYKMGIDNGAVHTVKYYVTNGSARLQALVRRVEWAENELSVIEQLQLLKLDTVVNERRVANFRTNQLTNPFFPPNFIPPPFPVDNGWRGASPLQRALGGQLAFEATPQATLQTIGFLEQVQTQLDAELKALPPQEKKAVEGPVEALRPRLEALARNAPPPPAQAAAPAAAPPALLPAPVAPQPIAQATAQSETIQRSQEIVDEISRNQQLMNQQIAQLQQQMKVPGKAVPLNPFAISQTVGKQFALVQQALVQKQ